MVSPKYFGFSTVSNTIVLFYFFSSRNKKDDVHGMLKAWETNPDSTLCNAILKSTGEISHSHTASRSKEIIDLTKTKAKRR